MLLKSSNYGDVDRFQIQIMVYALPNRFSGQAIRLLLLDAFLGMIGLSLGGLPIENIHRFESHLS